MENEAFAIWQRPQQGEMATVQKQWMKGMREADHMSPTNSQH